jgi:hypothetical protein
VEAPGVVLFTLFRNIQMRSFVPSQPSKRNGKRGGKLLNDADENGFAKTAKRAEIFAL